MIPIVTENDSVAVDEIAYGDNDTLSAVTPSDHAICWCCCPILWIVEDDPVKNKMPN
ncbi:MAG: hypothetical protein ACLRL6_16470 [Clostridium sp.]